MFTARALRSIVSKLYIKCRPELNAICSATDQAINQQSHIICTT